MYQYCEHIILAPHYMHVVQEFSGVDIHALACKHTYDVIHQSFKVHLDVGDNRVVGYSGRPIATILFIVDRLHDRIGIEHTRCLAKASAACHAAIASLRIVCRIDQWNKR